MKALVKKQAEPGLWLTDVPEPETGPGDVLIKVLRTGICGTDLHIRKWDGWAQQTIRTPLTIGHEFVGEVVSVGAAVADISVGDLVSGEGHLVCGKCRNCLAGRRHLCRNTIGLGVGRDGAFAEYVALPASTSGCTGCRSTWTWPRSSTCSATRCTPRSPSRWSARTC